jgi:DNA-binding NarL/FixJ family response regulator
VVQYSWSERIAGNGAGTGAQLFGRTPEIEWLTGSIRDAARGDGRVVLLEGQAGIGKTAILHHTARLARELDFRVLPAAAEEFEQRVPFATLARCLGMYQPGADPQVATIAGLLTGALTSDGPAGTARLEFVVTEAVLDLIDRWCARGPVALLVDDIQWADSGTLMLLHRLAGRLARQPLLLVATRRPVPSGADLEGLLRSFESKGVPLRALGPLDRAAVVDLATELVGVPPDDRLMPLLAGAGGNPFYLIELIGAMLREGRIRVEDGCLRHADDDSVLPRSLSDAVVRRLGFLPGPVWEILLSAAVLGGQFDPGELALVLEQPFATVLHALRQAAHAGLLLPLGERLTFGHDLLRRVLLEQVPPWARSALQVRIAQVLGESGAVERAPGLAVDVPGRAGPCADQPAESERVARAAAQLTESTAHRGHVYWTRAQACFRQGRLDAALTEVDQALALPSLDPTEAARLHGFAAQCQRYLGRPDLAEAALGRVARAGSDDPFATAYALNIRSGLEFTREHVEDALRLSAQAVAVLGDRPVPTDMPMAPHLTHGFNLMELDRLADADESFAAGLRLDERTGRLFTPFLHLGRALLRLWAGRWDDALAEIQASQEIRDPLGMSQGAHGVAALIAVHRNERVPGAALGGEPSAAIGGDFHAYLRAWATALVAEVDGDDRAALDLLLGLSQRLPTMIRPARYWLAPDIARLADMLAEREAAREIMAVTAELATRRPAQHVTATAMLCQGLVDEDAELIARAGEEFSRSGRALYAAYAWEGTAVVLAGGGRAGEARHALSAAVKVYDLLDAGWDSARALSRLRRLGVRHLPNAPRRQARAGWDAITETEWQVAGLVAEGLSNPEIGQRMHISRRTVQCHVSNILTKLSLASRIHLAIAVSQRAGSGSDAG